MEVLKSYYEISPFFFVVTASASLLFFISNLTMIFGGDASDDIDLVGPDHVPSDVSFKFFSTQTILAFFMGFGWAGITSTVKWSLVFSFALGIALCFGFILMTFTAFLMFQVNKLNHTSTVNIYSSLGGKGLVYREIPENGQGEVQVVVSGQQKIVHAISQGERLESFAEIEIIGIKDRNTLIVRRRST